MSTKCQQICWHDSDTYCYCSIFISLNVWCPRCYFVDPHTGGWLGGPPMIRFTGFVDMSTNCQQICWHSITWLSHTLSELIWHLRIYFLDPHAWDCLGWTTDDQVYGICWHVNKLSNLLTFYYWTLIYIMRSDLTPGKIFLSIHIWVIFGSR